MRPASWRHAEAAGEGLVAGVGVAGDGAVVLIERAPQIEGSAVEAEFLFVGFDAAEAGGKAAGVGEAVGIEGDVDVVEVGRAGGPELDLGPAVEDLKAGGEIAGGFGRPRGGGAAGFTDGEADVSVGVGAAEDGEAGGLEVFGEVGAQAGDVGRRALVEPDGLPETGALAVPVLFAAWNPGGAGGGAAGGRDDAGGFDRGVPDADGEGGGLSVGFRRENCLEGQVAPAGSGEVLVVDPDIGEPVGGAEDDDCLVAGGRVGDLELAAVPVVGRAGGRLFEDELGIDRRFDLGVEANVAQVGRVADAELPGALDEGSTRASHRLIP